MRECAEAARAAGADLLLLPELACVGLLWTDPEAGSADVAGVAALYDRALTPLFSDYSRILSRVAVSTGVTIAGASFWHRVGDRRLNSGFVCSPSGALLRQDKLHPTRPERAVGTEGGDSLTTFALAGVRMALVICYDLQFPEIVRPLADVGVEVILAPSLTDQRGYWRIRHAAHARAVENQCFVCVSPLVGELGIPVDRPLTGYGEAFVACPIDNRFGIADGTYARVEPGSEGPLTVTLDLDTLRHSRDRAEIRPLADRRRDLYATLAIQHIDLEEPACPPLPATS
jgi:predicted amidohydrolase